MEAKDRIIVALDVSSLDEAEELVIELEPHVGYFKVGLELLTAVGAPKIMEFFGRLEAKLGVKLVARIFFDGKFDDISNTVGKASAAASKHGVAMFNVHASAGIDAMMDAVANKGQSDVLAVTVLTSLEENIAHLIFGAPSKAKVLQFARDAKLAGVDGIICSAQELELLTSRRELSGLTWVVPGTRPPWAAANDQKRIMTPAEAIGFGVDMLVLGRPLTEPPAEVGKPSDAAKLVAVEIEEALASKAR